MNTRPLPRLALNGPFSAIKWDTDCVNPSRDNIIDLFLGICWATTMMVACEQVLQVAFNSVYSFIQLWTLLFNVALGEGSGDKSKT